MKRDKKKVFRFASLQGEKGQEVLQQFNLPTESFNSFVLLDNDGKVYTRSTAVLRMVKKLGGGWSLLYAGMIIPRFLRDPVYNFIARHRYKWFGKKETCWLPTEEYRSRFLD